MPSPSSARRRRPLSSIVLASALLAGPACAGGEIEGEWHVDRSLSLQTLTAKKTVSADEAAGVIAMFGASTLIFEGAAVRVAFGPAPVACAWTWGEAGEIRLSSCLDKRKQPAPGPARLELSGDGTIRLIEEDGSALAFRRAS